MAKGNRNSNLSAVENSEVTDNEVPETSASETAAPAVVAIAGPNFTLTYRREHPKNRCSYGIDGVSGIVVVDRNMLADPTYTGPLVLNVPLASPKLDGKAAKAEAQAAKAKEKADKAAAKLAAAQAKIQEKADKAAAALKAAQDKVAAAQVKASEAPAGDPPSAQ